MSAVEKKVQNTMDNERASTDDASAKSVLTIDGAAFSYNNRYEVFSDLRFDLEAGKMLCLLGPNGCGKTTLLNCIAGLYKLNSGDIKIDDESLNKMQPSQRARTIGYVPQIINATFDYSVLDYVVTGCAPYLKLFARPKQEDYDRAYEALKQMQMDQLAEKSYAQISGGERQQVSIARVVVQRPAFILLDEPTAHLDFGNQLRLLELAKSLADEGFGILMTTHNPDQVLILDSDVIIMQKGVSSCICGRGKELITQDSLQNLYGIDILLEESEGANRNVCVAKGL
ncbi:MAG: ABC transporter ATP-binding protein [Coriobacteriales bacterium]|nr:ABC transporter ATP-binding protein [Coriobacteriales bacterium]